MKTLPKFLQISMFWAFLIGSGVVHAQSETYRCPSPPSDCSFLAQVQLNDEGTVNYLQQGLSEGLKYLEQTMVNAPGTTGILNPPPFPANLNDCTPEKLRQASLLKKLEDYLINCPGLPKTLFMSEEEFQSHQQKGLWGRWKEKILDRTPPAQMALENVRVRELDFGPPRVRRITVSDKKTEALNLALNDSTKVDIYYYPYPEFEVEIPLKKFMVDSGMSLKVLEGDIPQKDMREVFHTDKGMRITMKEDPQQETTIKVRVGLRPGGNPVEIREIYSSVHLPLSQLSFGYGGSLQPITDPSGALHKGNEHLFPSQKDFVNYTFLAAKLNGGLLSQGGGVTQFLGNGFTDSLLKKNLLPGINEKLQTLFKSYQNEESKIHYNLDFPSANQMLNQFKIDNRLHLLKGDLLRLKNRYGEMVEVGDGREEIRRHLEGVMEKEEKKAFKKLGSQMADYFKKGVEEIRENLKKMYKEDLGKMVKMVQEQKTPAALGRLEEARQYLQEVLVFLQDISSGPMGLKELQKVRQDLDAMIVELQGHLKKLGPIIEENRIFAALTASLTKMEKPEDPLTLAIAQKGPETQDLTLCPMVKTPEWDKEMEEEEIPYQGTVTFSVKHVNQMLGTLHRQGGFHFCYNKSLLELCSTSLLAPGMEVNLQEAPQLAWDEEEKAFFVDLSKVKLNERGPLNILRPLAPDQIKGRIYLKLECEKNPNSCLRTEVRGTVVDERNGGIINGISGGLKKAFGLNKAFNFLMKKKEESMATTFPLPETRWGKVVGIKQNPELIKFYVDNP